MKLQTDPYSKAMKNYVIKQKSKTKIYIIKQIAQYFGLQSNLLQPLKKVCFPTEILGNFFKHIYFCFTPLFNYVILHRLA